MFNPTQFSPLFPWQSDLSPLLSLFFFISVSILYIHCFILVLVLYMLEIFSVYHTGTLYIVDPLLKRPQENPFTIIQHSHLKIESLKGFGNSNEHYLLCYLKIRSNYLKLTVTNILKISYMSVVSELF